MITNELRGFDLVTGTEFIVAPMSQYMAPPVAGGDYCRLVRHKPGH